MPETDADATIETVYAYKADLHLYQQGIGNSVVHHLFIVFKTKSWYWSIEKNTEAIIIQRSQAIETVKNVCLWIPRDPNLERVKEEAGNRSVVDLIERIHTEGELNKTYHYEHSNCIVFGNADFSYIASGTLHDAAKRGFHVFQIVFICGLVILCIIAIKK